MVDIEAQVRRLGATGDWPAPHLLLWEATDLYDYILETQSLSVVRGASVLLDLFCEHVDEVLRDAAIDEDHYALVQASASKVVLVVRDEQVAAVAGPALHARFQQPPFRGASAWVSAPLDATPVATQIAALSARIVLQRMRQLDVDTGGYPTPLDPGVAGVDPIDGVRLVPRDAPATRTLTADDDEGLRLSDHTRPLFRVGQQHRFGLAEALYTRWCQRQGDEYHGSTWTLSQWASLAEEQPIRSTDRPFPDGTRFLQDFQTLGQASRLPGYIAVIEADGNSFSRWMAQFSGVADIARAAAVLERAIHDALVTALDPELAAMHAAITAGGQAVQQAQLIVSAGDEFVVVLRGDRGLPAALDFLSAWPDAARRAADDFGLVCDRPLHTHGFGLGLVISHATTPIRHLRRAAHELLEEAKERARQTPPADGQASSALDFALLKSHDVPPDGVVKEREHWLSSPGSDRKIHRGPRPPAELSALVDLARHLLDQGFPQRQLERRAAWLSGPWLEGNAAWKDRPRWSDDAKAIVETLPDRWRGWLTKAGDPAIFELRDLLDLVAVEDRQATGQGGRP
ncbi:MAG: hypothetical protein D6798_05870 [Deltaproteobacteria bacterium]|nr:MAG: hypothetical protein D6798_05870 [Deltaproteobacteria bacterium]